MQCSLICDLILFLHAPVHVVAFKEGAIRGCRVKRYSYIANQRDSKGAPISWLACAFGHVLGKRSIVPVHTFSTAHESTCTPTCIDRHRYRLLGPILLIDPAVGCLLSLQIHRHGSSQCCLLEVNGDITPRGSVSIPICWRLGARVVQIVIKVYIMDRCTYRLALASNCSCTLRGTTKPGIHCRSRPRQGSNCQKHWHPERNN